jgi:hypothetical protein
VHGADPRRCRICGCGVPVCDSQHVAAGRCEAAEWVSAPIAVLRNAGHGQRMKRLDHQRAHARKRKGPIAVDTPDEALRSEKTRICRMLRNRPGEGPRQWSHHLDSRFAVDLGAQWLGAHAATIPRPVTRSRRKSKGPARCRPLELEAESAYGLIRLILVSQLARAVRVLPHVKLVAL